MNQPTANGKGPKHKSYSIRKLCSGIEEYEASPPKRLEIDFAKMEKQLNFMGLKEVFVNSLYMTVILEELDVTAKIYPSGMIHLMANEREDCEIACDMLFSIMPKSLRSNI